MHTHGSITQCKEKSAPKQPISPNKATIFSLRYEVLDSLKTDKVSPKYFFQTAHNGMYVPNVKNPSPQVDPGRGIYTVI